MITMEESENIAKSILVKKEKEIGFELKISLIRETEYGNVYFYNSKEYVETGNFRANLLGNSPFIVDIEDGVVHFFGTAFSLERYLGEYEKYRSQYGEMRTF